MNKKVVNDNILKSISKENLNMVLCMLKIIKYGSITLVVQDGKVIQVEKKEKVRLIFNS